MKTAKPFSSLTPLQITLSARSERDSVAPGIIRTRFHEKMTPEARKHNIENRIPLHREGTPEDVAEAVVSLIQNDFITGGNIVIDGGMTMRIG